jgi:signal transduction histidine kinase
MSSRSNALLPKFQLRWRGFTLQFFLFTILPLTLLLLVVVFGSQSLHHDAMRSMVGDRDLRAARAAANSLGEQLNHRAATLQILSRQVVTRANLEAVGSGVRGLNDDFEGGLALLNPDGTLISATQGSIFDQMDVQTLAQILQAARPQISDGPVFSPAFQVASGEGPYWVLVVQAVPNQDTLVGAFTPASLTRAALTGAIDPAQTSVVLSTSGGILLYQSGPLAGSPQLARHPGILNALQGESGIDYLHSSDGEHVVAFNPIPLTGWGLMLEETWDTIASPILNTTQAAPLVLVPLLILALVALWFGARQIVQPLQALQTRMSRLARGDFKAVEPPVGGIQEIRMLQSDLIDMAHQLRAAQNSLHGYIGAITSGVENERRSLARELHDDTLQTLIALQQRIQLTNRTGENQESMRELQALVQQTITNLRRMVRGLRPIYLEDLGLSASLNMLAQETSTLNGLEVFFECQGDERRLPAETELALYRMTQEALSNITRHAQAQQAWLEIEYSPRRVLLSVRDNGRGFTVPTSPDEFARQGHFGLLGLQERAEIITADLTIQSAPGQGTTVRVEWVEGAR